MLSINTDNCEIRVPSGLTPNAQFDNKLFIRGLENYPDNKFKVFNRYGSLVYEAAPYQNDWDGVPNVGHNITEGDGKVPDGTYFYILELAPGSDPLTRVHLHDKKLNIYCLLCKRL